LSPITLITREKLDAIRIEQAKALQSNEVAVRLMSMRLTNGTVGSLDVLETKQRLYSSQVAVSQTEVNRRLIMVQLYKALGGGWKLTDAQRMAPPSAPAAQAAPLAKQP
jgi:outer membrane protein, multidrug efflux system